MSIIDTYLEKVSEPEKIALERVRKIIKKTVPDAEESISYGMPAFKYKKKYLVAFCEFKDHMSLFPGSEAIEKFKAKLEGYKLSKGTIQFTLEHPLSETLIREIVLSRVDDITKS
ncbi:MAG TPA: DUF1801 domain-containing protein [Patescibacteria group bacterium]